MEAEGRWIDHLVWLLLTVAVALIVRLASIPEEILFASLASDDALYFLVPTRHFVEGKGFSFDGVHPTSGVQPFWAIVATGVAYVIPDRTLAIRVLCGLSGFCWLLAGTFAYLSLRPLRKAGALFVATAWVLTGFWNRLAFMSMENGLHALCFAALLWYGLRCSRRDSGPETVRLLLFGTLAALFALGSANRTKARTS